MLKVLILGNSGSGKSTFAQKIGNELSVPVYHMDEIILDKNYVPFEDATNRIQDILNKNTWIIDGVYSGIFF